MGLLRKYSGFGWVLASLFFITSSTGWSGYQLIYESKTNSPMPVVIYRLDNGLTVYVAENKDSPHFNAEIAVRAGSKHDPADSTGLAHYLEHMLFKGTERLGTLDYEKEKPNLDRISELYEKHFHENDSAKRKEIYAEINRESQLAARYAIPNEMDKLYKAMGEIGLNAHTSDEETVYTVALPRNRLEHWAMIESERFRGPVFRLFQPELEIVYEEKNQSLDNKGELIRQALAKLLYKKHPYGQQTTIGEVAHLKNPSLKSMYGFYETYYVPNNMAVCLAGDIQKRSAIRLIDRYFSVWQAKPLPAPKSWPEEPLRGSERVTVQYQGEEYVLLAFRTAPRRHPDAEALKLIDMILDNAVAGLINLNLNQSQKVRQAGSYPELNNDYGAQYLWGIPKKRQSLKEVEDLLLDQVERIKRADFEDWILSAIVNDFKKTRKLQWESNSGRASLMREAFIAYEDWERIVGEMARMERLTKANVAAAAKKYFGGGYVAGYRIDQPHEVPKISKPEIEKITIDPTRQSDFFKEVLALPAQEIEPVFVVPGVDYRKTNLAEGLDFYYAPNPINDLFSIVITVDIGARHNDRLGLAAEFLDKSGTEHLSPEALKKEWYKLGTDFSIFTGDQETSIALAGLDENFSSSWRLLIDLLAHPAADPQALEELKRIVLIRREDAKKDYRTIARALVQYNRYGQDSSFLRSMSNEQVMKLTPEELHGLIKELLRYRHTVSYTGPLPLEKVVKLLSHRVEPLLRAPPGYQFLKVADTPRNRVFLFPKTLAQSQIQIEFGNGEFNEGNNPVIQFHNDYFSGGMSGIVFQELREGRALAYSAGAVYANGGRKGDQNLMMGYLGSQADKTPEALEALLELMDNLPVSPERFAESRQALVNRYRASKLGFREILGAVRAWERLQVPVDPRKQRFEKIQKIAVDDILQFHREHLKGRPKLISIVGDKAKMDLERIGRIGPVTELGLTNIFSF